mgnify:CR=1 FL=1
MKPDNLPEPEEYFRVMEEHFRNNPDSPWLEVFCRRAMQMRGYSTRNVALILTQFSKATYVAGKSQYEQMGADVRPNAFPIAISVPLASSAETKTTKFTWAMVYDIKHTTMEYLPYEQKITPKECLQKAVHLAKQAGMSVAVANIASGAWKELHGTNLYLRKGVSTEIMCQLIFHELAYVALVKEGTNERQAYSLAAIVSYSVGVGLGLEMPPLSQPHKIVACEGAGLLPNMDKSLKVAKRIAKALNKA